MLVNTGEQPVFSGNGLITTIAWGIGDKVDYALRRFSVRIRRNDTVAEG